MSNIIQIKHGQSFPDTDKLQPFELGYRQNSGLFINTPGKVKVDNALWTENVILPASGILIVKAKINSLTNKMNADYTYENIETALANDCVVRVLCNNMEYTLAKINSGISYTFHPIATLENLKNIRVTKNGNPQWSFVEESSISES